MPTRPERGSRVSTPAAPAGAGAVPGARREPRAEARARLVAAAERLVERGEPFSMISIERLTSEADMPRTRFYNYFDDRHELLVLWLERAKADVLAAARGWWALTAAPTKPELEAIFRTLLEAHRRHRHLFAAVSEAMATDERTEGELGELMRLVIAGLQAHIERGQRAGWIDAALLAPESAAWIAWGWERNASLIADPADAAGFERSLRGLTDFVWAALYRDG
jgi:TetR/AcrR family transcriptional regulator, ethionamide resistance regulator